jgi:hypothetical protein
VQILHCLAEEIDMRRIVELVVVMLVLAWGSVAEATLLRDQGQIFGTGGVLQLGTEQWFQSITVGIAGELSGIQIQFDSGLPTPTPALTLSIYDSGDPVAASVLYSEMLFLSGSDLNPDQVFGWDIRAAGLQFDAGDMFGFGLQAEGSGHQIAGNDPPGYAGGALFENSAPASDLSDIGFITYVTPRTGGSLNLLGQLTDSSTGVVYGFELHAEEDLNNAGVGGMFFTLGGPNLSMCDAHGPGAAPGTNPFEGFECGGSGNVSVRVDGCEAEMETHGFVHSDHPNTVYIGSMTVDIAYHQRAGHVDGRLFVVVHTPKKSIKLMGDVSADDLEMETCF